MSKEQPPKRILGERELYKPIVGRLSPRTPQPPELQAYLSIFHDGAEVPLKTFTQDGGNNGYIEAITGLLEKGAVAIEMRDGIPIVKAVPIESQIKFKPK